LIRRIDQELGAEVQRQKAEWADTARVARERGPRLQRYEAVAKHVIDLKQSALELPLDAVQDDAVVQWFDERIVAFVKAYLALLRQDVDLRERLKDQLVEDPVTKIRFPKYLAASTPERDGRTYYFVDEDTRREFEKEPARKP
jgi:YHS domain-containing protein